MQSSSVALAANSFKRAPGLIPPSTGGASTYKVRLGSEADMFCVDGTSARRHFVRVIGVVSGTYRLWVEGIACCVFSQQFP
jgi:hypothetical protein